ncbi:MAG: glycosyltransferase family 2 protein [Candidatus Moraniibacteriota bacterium]
MISIIIVNYRSKTYLDKCLFSIDKHSFNEDLEIIVINNDQKEKLMDLVERYPRVKLYQNKKNMGFGAACNFGARKAQGEKLLFLNPDTQFLNNYIREILIKIQKYQNVAIIGPRLITDEGKTQEWSTGKETNFIQIIKNNLWMTESRYFWESKNDIFVDWVSGAAMFIKKDVFDKIGGFDEKFFMYGEDMDLCAQARELGYDILYSPELTILHSGGKSRKSLIKQKIQFFKSSLYYLAKRRLKK